MELKDDNPKYFVSLVDIYVQENNIEAAIPLLEKVHKLRPANLDYLLSLASLYEEQKNLTQATHRYTKIIEINPHHPLAKQKLS